ncbi:hypothetical protein BpHYR1_015719 [Brachionus plicatilis]|uniref:Uncharacterized protein n=1 Tax=Brachionus plicatilis TaxID=10195 RepID=A0A3M7RAE6_BRAPC|nr:hypothetical protein BpHYR1_015719 [Brachionus plicatilis]
MADGRRRCCLVGFGALTALCLIAEKFFELVGFCVRGGDGAGQIVMNFFYLVLDCFEYGFVVGAFFEAVAEFLLQLFVQIRKLVFYEACLVGFFEYLFDPVPVIDSLVVEARTD